MSCSTNDSVHVQPVGNFVSFGDASFYAGARGQEDFGFAPWPGGSAFPAGLSVQSLVTLAPHFSTAPPGSIWTQKNSIWRGSPPFFFSALKTWFRAEFGNDPKNFCSNAPKIFSNAPKICFRTLRNETNLLEMLQKSPPHFRKRLWRRRRCHFYQNLLCMSCKHWAATIYQEQVHNCYSNSAPL